MTIVSSERGVRGAAISALFALAVGLGAAGAVGGADGVSIAAAATSKCKKGAQWRCAAKHYHLSAEGFYTHASIAGTYSFSQSFSAEIDLKKRRSNVGGAEYTQEGGTVTLSGTGWATGEGSLTHCDGDVTNTVPQQKVSVPPGGLFDQLDLFLDFELIGRDKNTYTLWVGNNSYTNIGLASGTETCPSKGTSASFDNYQFNGSSRLDPQVHPGRPWNHRLTGSEAGGGDWLKWTLTAKRR